jgi:hypothetical protein
LEDAHIHEPYGYCREVIQDLLNALGTGLDMKKHVVDRVAKRREEVDNEGACATKFMGYDERGQIDALVQEISNEISRVVFGAWGDILGKTIANKRVQVDWALDAELETLHVFKLQLLTASQSMRCRRGRLVFNGFFSFIYTVSTWPEVK